ncbi:hypothetical protein [Deinococcus sp. QL22]|uniref:hypothetical protein n=1 Tax=Deinococcus sp. QL22 TaxID=2939437 RepID=UPI002017BFCB|nr:hypothetical protein [Deinococcus sp. QL22]UQN06768.1 hypothetical protein M1R55_02270 [Deinococcus sp. QL22]
MNQLQILVALLAAAVADPAKTSLFAQANINSNVKDPFLSLMPRVAGASYSFEASSLNMVVTPLMPVAMNSPFPNVGAVAPDSWKGETDKYAGEIPVDEPTMRQIQDTLLRLGGQANSTLGTQTAQGFIQKLLGNLRDAADLSEKIARAEAIMTGKYVGKAAIFGVKGQKLIGKADYKVNRVVAAGAHDQANSTFWPDLETGEQKLLSTVQRRYISEKTFIKIKAQAANGIIETGRRVQNDDGTYTVTISRLAKKADGSFDTLSQNFDAQYRDVEFIVVKTQEFQVPGPDGKLVKLSFGSDGTIALIGAARVGQLYVAPTVEGAFKGVALDRYVYIAQPRDWEIAGRAVENFVPVVEGNRDVTVIETGIVFA